MMASHEAERVRNYEMAGLIAFAHHQPEKMPKYKAIGAASEPVSDEADQARVRGMLIAMSMSSTAQH